MASAERPRTVLFVCHYLHHVVGGAEIIAHRIVQFLRAAGWRVETVVLPGPRPAPADATHPWNLPGRMNPASLLAKQLAVYAGGVVIDQTAARAVLPALRGRAFDIVVAHDTVSGGAASILARTLGIPWACFVYEPLPRALPNAPGPKGWIGGMLTRHANRAMRRLLPRATLRIAASADTGRRLDAFAPGPPTVVAYNSAPVLETPPPPGEGLLFVGRLSSEKGFDLLCDAYRGLASPPPLNIAALDGPLAGLARDLSANTHPSVSCLGRRPRTCLRCTPATRWSSRLRHGPTPFREPSWRRAPCNARCSCRIKAASPRSSRATGRCGSSRCPRPANKSSKASVSRCRRHPGGLACNPIPRRRPSSANDTRHKPTHPPFSTHSNAPSLWPNARTQPLRPRARLE